MLRDCCSLFCIISHVFLLCAYLLLFILWVSSGNNKNYLWCSNSGSLVCSVKGKTSGTDKQRHAQTGTDFISPATRSSFADNLQPESLQNYAREGEKRNEREREKERERDTDRERERGEDMLAGSSFRKDACMHMRPPLLLIFIILIILKGKYQVSLQLALIYGNGIYHACSHTHKHAQQLLSLGCHGNDMGPEKKQKLCERILCICSCKQRERKREGESWNFPQIFIIKPLQMICMHWVAYRYVIIWLHGRLSCLLISEIDACIKLALQTLKMSKIQP